jgi:CRISPR system Cascade subunit CasC
MSSRFLQVHFLTSYPAALLNRDDAGFAKRLPFGGAIRTRISSQCQKRHWRLFEGEGSLRSLEVPGSVHSRHTFEMEIAQPLVKSGLDEEKVRAVVQAIADAVLGKSDKKKAEEGVEKKPKSKKAKEEDTAHATAAQAVAGVKGEPKSQKDTDTAHIMTAQLTVLGRPEIEFLKKLTGGIVAEIGLPAEAADAVKRKLDKAAQQNLKTMVCGAGLDAALFGRMVTSDMLARGDAALHVAHAFTVHAEASESDYFTAVDDLKPEGEDTQGSAHINSSELTSGLYYGYVVVDVPLLVSNLTGCERKAWEGADRTIAAQVVDRVVRLVATVSPGAKLGSTAPYANAHAVLVEAGNAQPRTLANAFLRPVSDKGDLLANTYDALAAYLTESDEMYGRTTVRRLAAMHPSDGVVKATHEKAPLAEVASFAASTVLGA